MRHDVMRYNKHVKWNCCLIRFFQVNNEQKENGIDSRVIGSNMRVHGNRHNQQLHQVIKLIIIVDQYLVYYAHENRAVFYNAVNTRPM